MASDVIKKSEVINSPSLSLSPSHQEMSRVVISSSHLSSQFSSSTSHHEKADFDSNLFPCQELSASLDGISTDSYSINSSSEEEDREGWVSLGQFDDRLEYITSELPGEVAGHCSLAVSTEQPRPPSQGSSKPLLPLDKVIVTHKCHTLPRGHMSTGTVGLCIDECYLGSWEEDPIVVCLDSGSDLTLISEAMLKGLKRPPQVHSVKGF